MNVDVLLRAKDSILRHPREVCMAVMHSSLVDTTFASEEPIVKLRGVDVGRELPYKCNTAHCIAGWIELNETGAETCNAIDIAAGLLEIFEETAWELFYLADWPDDLRERYIASPTHEAAASVVAERIDRFIAEN